MLLVRGAWYVELETIAKMKSFLLDLRGLTIHKNSMTKSVEASKRAEKNKRVNGSNLTPGYDATSSS
jgi:hypothetical protein